MRTPIVAANWKMHKTVADATAFIKEFLGAYDKRADRQVVIAPPFTALSAVASELKSHDEIFVAAQNMHYEEQGAFTGEVAPPMLLELGVRWVILGHSERRHIFKEDDALIAKKVDSALRHGMTPILCIGERLEEREAGAMEEILQGQLEAGFSKVEQYKAEEVVIAYEPVWAIGTGKTATPQQACEAHGYVRRWLGQRFGQGVAERIRILYGGSVKPANIAQLMAEDEIDGVLVGGASLDPKSFLALVNYG